MKKIIISLLMMTVVFGTAFAAKKSKTAEPAPAAKAPTGIVDGLATLAGKLVQSSTGKPTYAFMALTSDDGNALVENYVTDALTEAMFSTGKIKIVGEQASKKL